MAIGAARASMSPADRAQRWDQGPTREGADRAEAAARSRWVPVAGPAPRADVRSRGTLVAKFPDTASHITIGTSKQRQQS